MKIIILLSIALLAVAVMVSMPSVYGHWFEPTDDWKTTCMFDNHKQVCIKYSLGNAGFMSFNSDFKTEFIAYLHLYGDGVFQISNFFRDVEGYSDDYTYCIKPRDKDATYEYFCGDVFITEGWLMLGYKQDYADRLNNAEIRITRHQITMFERLAQIMQEQFDRLMEQVAIQSKNDNGPDCVVVYPICVPYHFTDIHGKHGKGTFISGERIDDKTVKFVIQTIGEPGAVAINADRLFKDEPPWYYIVTNEDGEVQYTGGIKERWYPNKPHLEQYMSPILNEESKYIEIGVGSAP